MKVKGSYLISYHGPFKLTQKAFMFTIVYWNTTLESTNKVNSIYKIVIINKITSFQINIINKITTTLVIYS